MDQLRQHLSALRARLCEVKDTIESAKLTSKNMHALMEESMDDLVSVGARDDPGLWIQIDKELTSRTLAYMDAEHEVDKHEGLLQIIEIRIKRIQDILDAPDALR